MFSRRQISLSAQPHTLHHRVVSLTRKPLAKASLPQKTLHRSLVKQPQSSSFLLMALKFPEPSFLLPAPPPPSAPARDPG